MALFLHSLSSLLFSWVGESSEHTQTHTTGLGLVTMSQNYPQLPISPSPLPSSAAEFDFQELAHGASSFLSPFPQSPVSIHPTHCTPLTIGNATPRDSIQVCASGPRYRLPPWFCSFYFIKFFIQVEMIKYNKGKEIEDQELTRI